MTTYNTGNPLGSSASKDLYDNAQNFDFALNSLTQSIWLDRFGVGRRSWYGLEVMVAEAAESYGIITLDGVTFTTGATVNLNEALLNTANDTYYKWTGSFPSGGKVVPINSTPDSTGGIGPGKWLSVGDTVLRNDLAKPDGAQLIGFKSTTASERFSKVVYITDFGGGESVPDNLEALNAAKTAASVGGRIRFPKNGNGIYNFPTGFPDFSGFVVSPDDGVVMQSPATPNMAVSSIVTDNDYRVYFNSGDPHNYYIDIRANYHIGSKGANKSLWLSEGDIENSAPMVVDASTIPVKQLALGSGDNVIDATPAGRSVSSLFLQPPTGGNTQLGVIPATPGIELKVGGNTVPDNSGEIAIGLIFTTGYAVVRGYPASGTWSLSTKYIGQASTDSAITPDGGGTPTYSPSNNLITVRCISPIRAQIFVNGVSVADIQISSGALLWMGVGATSIAAISGSNFTGWYKRSFRVSASPRSQVLGIIGDSISDGAVHGAWPVWCAEALDGSLGIRINSIENRAISGQTLDQQIANLTAHPFVNASVVAVFIGTNDIQGGNTLAAFQASLTTLLK